MPTAASSYCITICGRLDDLCDHAWSGYVYWRLPFTIRILIVIIMHGRLQINLSEFNRYWSSRMRKIWIWTVRYKGYSSRISYKYLLRILDRVLSSKSEILYRLHNILANTFNIKAMIKYMFFNSKQVFGYVPISLKTNEKINLNS